MGVDLAPDGDLQQQAKNAYNLPIMVRSDENWTPESDGLMDILSLNQLEVPCISWSISLTDTRGIHLLITKRPLFLPQQI